MNYFVFPDGISIYPLGAIRCTLRVYGLNEGRGDVIPTAIALGLVGGAIDRYRWWSIPVVGAIWSFLLMTVGDTSMSGVEIWTGGFALGAINGAFGVVVSWGLLELIRGTLRRFGKHPADHLRAR